MTTPLRLLAGTAVALCVATTAAAQDRESSQTGLFVGWSLTTISNLDAKLPNTLYNAYDLRTTSNNHVQYGAYARFPIWKRLQIEPEVHIITKGATNVEGPAQFAANQTKSQSAGVVLEYIELPVLLRVELPGHIGRFSPFVLAGPSAALRRSCKYHVKASNFDGFGGCGGTLESGEQIDSRYVTWEAGAIAGAGMRGTIRRSVISLQLRYGQSLNNMAPSAERVQHNSGYSLLMGIELP